MHLDQRCETNPLSQPQSVNTCPVLPSGLMNGQTNPGALLMQPPVSSMNQLISTATKFEPRASPSTNILNKGKVYI